MRIALVHDYIAEFGGAERVLEVLAQMFPDAPIYTAYCKKDSKAYEHFKDRKIIESWAAIIPFFPKLASPLRFLTPWIWGSLDLSKFDLVISSASWYVTKGFGSRQNPNLKFKISNLKLPVEICYCHTPPRWLYGYKTSVEWQKYTLVRLYGKIVGNFIRKYDYEAAQRVDYFIANSKEVAGRIKKFYSRDSKVIYPPVSLPNVSKEFEKKDYYFIVTRLVGVKGIDMALEASQKMGFKLKIAGAKSGYYSPDFEASNNVEYLGYVSDEELVRLYSEAKGFLALAKDEDFGITPVESMLCGTPVIAFNGGGYKETVAQGRAGVLFDDYSVEGLEKAIEKFEKSKFDSDKIREYAQKFSKERFKKEIQDFVKSKIK